MKKFFLIVFITLCAIFIYLKVESLGSPSSSFNQTTRYQLGHYQLWRSILGLHSYGDARAWYLEGNQQIRLDVVEANGADFSSQALSGFVDEIKKYTGRGVQVYDYEKINNGVLSDQDIQTIVANDHNTNFFGQPELFVLYVQDYNHPDGEVAKTYQEYGIIVSHDQLMQVTKYFPDSLPEYEQSTLLHEFGHQLGLEHDTGNNCVMNAAVDHPILTNSFSGNYTPTDFCQSEVDSINAIKAALQ